MSERARLRVRWKDGGFEAKCPLCSEFLAVTEEFWFPRSGVTRCRACWTEYRRLRQRGYMADEAMRRVTRIKNRMHYQANREQYGAMNAAWKARNRPRVKAYRAAHYALGKGDPSLMERYRLEWPDGRGKVTDPAAATRARWREQKRRQRLQEVG